MIISNQKRNAVGISFSDRSIEFLVLEKGGQPKRVSIALPVGAFVSGLIVNKKAIIKALKIGWKKIKQAKNKVIISLPINQIYLQAFDLSVDLNGASLQTEIIKAVQENVSIDFDDVYWNYITKKSGDKQNIIFAGAERSLVDDYRAVFIKAGLDLVGIDIATLALARSLLYPTKNKAWTIMVELGWDQSSLACFDEEGWLMFVDNLPASGKQLAEIIKEDYNISLAQAEQLKQSFGLINSRDNLSFSILTSKFKMVAKKIIRLVAEVEAESGQSVSRIILAGEDALMPGLANFLAKEINRPVIVGQPLPKIGLMQTNQDENIILSEVIGLALLGEHSHMIHVNLLGESLALIKNINNQKEINIDYVRAKMKRLCLIVAIVISLILCFFLISKTASKELSRDNKIIVY